MEPRKEVWIGSFDLPRTLKFRSSGRCTKPESEENGVLGRIAEEQVNLGLCRCRPRGPRVDLEPRGIC